jgi:hypothetical protein
VFPQQVARDDELLDLAHSIENAKCPGVPLKSLQSGSCRCLDATSLFFIPVLRISGAFIPVLRIWRTFISSHRISGAFIPIIRISGLTRPQGRISHSPRL